MNSNTCSNKFRHCPIHRIFIYITSNTWGQTCLHVAISNTDHAVHSRTHSSASHRLKNRLKTVGFCENWRNRFTPILSVLGKPVDEFKIIFLKKLK
jgi:hypothetical protein